MKITLSTQDLNLRLLKDEDAKNISLYAGDPAVARMTASLPLPFLERAAEVWIMTMRSRRERDLCYPYAVTVKGSDELIGVMDLFKNTLGEFEIGYWIAKPYWGNGYASQAGEAVISEARASLNLTEIDASVYEGNKGSIKVLQKLGFDIIGPAKPLFSIARRASVGGTRLQWRQKRAIKA